MASIIISTVAFFVASYFIGRYLDDPGIPKGFTRAVVVFVIAAIISYAIAWMIDLIIV